MEVEDVVVVGAEGVELEEVEEATDDEYTCRVADVVLLSILGSGVDVWTSAMIRYVAGGVPTGTMRLVTTVIVVRAGTVPSETVARREEEADVND